MTGPTTYAEAAEMPFADVLNRWQALNDRDSMARAIATLQARGEWTDDRSLDPADYPPLVFSEHLELIALGEVIARRLTMTRSLILIGAALAAVAWLMHQPAFTHATHHKQAVALIAITVPFLALDIILGVARKRRARARAARVPAVTRVRAGAGR